MDSTRFRGTVWCMHSGRLRFIMCVFLLGLFAAVSGVVVALRSAVPPVSSEFSQVSAGAFHTCALRADSRILCWGLNTAGEVGIGRPGTGSDRGFVLNSDNSIRVEVGGEHSCSVDPEGGLSCWGYNGYGQLGDASTKQRWLPTRVARLKGAVAEISLGTYHTCAVDSSAHTYCWGRNTSGQIGDGSTENALIPKRIADLPATVAIAAGARHTCALLHDGKVLCWGEGTYGQLGNGSFTSSALPIEVKAVENAVSVVAGDAHTCALTQERTVICWGANSFQELGNTDRADRNSPVVVHGVTGVRVLSAGGKHTCALKETGRVMCWGRDSVGQLGSGPAAALRSDIGAGPSEVLLDDVVTLDAGGIHTCAIGVKGLYCWGGNSRGQIGDGTVVDRPLPVVTSSGD